MVIELRVLQFWSKIILVISNRTRATRSFDFGITRIISDQIALHSVQLPLYITSVAFIMVGRCNSTFHNFLTDVLDKVSQEVQHEGKQAKPMQLPHCTWDKFGDILANSGARSIGLFDELVSFFSTMNMYSATKSQVSDTKEYQDFLQMYTGKAKTRETGELPIVLLT